MRSVSKLIRQINNLPSDTTKTAVAGFDATVDTIMRPVKRISLNNEIEFFSTIDEFGQYISAQSGKSCSVDMRRVSRRPGGNAPNLSRCLSALGIDVSCIGTMGFPEPLDIFRHTGKNLISIGDVGECIALQFDDGKIMLSDMSVAEDIGYEVIEQIIGKDMLYRLLSEADMIGFLNWAEMSCATHIWRSILQNIFALEQPDKSKLLFIDLTDCSKKAKEEILEIKEVVDGCFAYRKVIWSLNEKEAFQLAACLGCDEGKPLKLARLMMSQLKADMLFIHGHNYCVGADRCQAIRVPGFFVQKPLISVGGGDHFNAGLAFALIHEFNMEDACLFANSVASYFVRYGASPSVQDISSFLEHLK